jgi:hypothetical protein
MKTTLFEELRGTLPEGREQMVVTIFYPDAAYGAQLVAAFHRALAGLGEMEAMDPRPWRLDVLQWPEMQAEATRDVACSRVVVVPADESYARSEFFRRWVAGWPATDERRLLLVPRRGAAETPTQVRQFVQWLQEICAGKGMDFTEGELTEVPTPSAVSQKAMGGRGLVPPLVTSGRRDTLAAYVPELEKPAATRFWGLNE